MEGYNRRLQGIKGNSVWGTNLGREPTSFTTGQNVEIKKRRGTEAITDGRSTKGGATNLKVGGQYIGRWGVNFEKDGGA